jgi:hypothetical protein
MSPDTDRMIGLFSFSKYYRVSTAAWRYPLILHGLSQARSPQRGFVDTTP